MALVSGQEKQAALRFPPWYLASKDNCEYQTKNRDDKHKFPKTVFHVLYPLELEIEEGVVGAGHQIAGADQQKQDQHQQTHKGHGQHGKAGLAAGHHVGVVAENAEALAREGARGDVEHGRRKLARDFVHVGDHQEEALRRGKRRSHRARRERAVHGTGGAAFGLHLDHARNRAPDVRLRERGELVARLSHGRGRGDRIDRGHFGARERDLGSGGIAVNHDLFSHFLFPFSVYSIIENFPCIIRLFTIGIKRSMLPQSNRLAPVTSRSKRMDSVRLVLVIIGLD